MEKRKFLMLMVLAGMACAAAVFPWGTDLAYGNAGLTGTFYANSPAGGASGPAIQKFIDTLPGLTSTGANSQGQYIPIASPDTTTIPGSDYYVIGETEYTRSFHPALAAIKSGGSKLRGYYQINTGTTLPTDNAKRYLGPLIVAQVNRPVRVRFVNQLANPMPIPVDPTLMGAGAMPSGGGNYSELRTAVHLHGGFTPWISDGTPYQWFTPSGITYNVNRGVSFQKVPDMAPPAPGEYTCYYTNQQSSRLMFYHDHAVGITRLNVYDGMAAGYLLYDPVNEDPLISAGTIPTGGGAFSVSPLNPYNWGIPLIIQDKTFVPSNVAAQDARWSTIAWGAPGDLWWPHIYEPNQNVNTPAFLGASLYGRWDYGPWVWPNITAPVGPNAPAPKSAVALPSPATLNDPSLYTKCTTPEAFMDTPVVNGAAYPYLVVQPQAYRFRILNACNDRYLNLQLYQADTGGGAANAATAVAALSTSPGPIAAVVLISGGAGYTKAPGVYISGGTGSGATAVATLTPTTVASLTLSNGGSGYSATPTVTIVGGGATSVATATATVTGGIITGLTVTSPGAGYTSNPTVVFSDTTGTDAMATVNLTPTTVSGVTLTSPGSGYTLPAVLIASKTALPAPLGATVSTGEVRMVPAAPTNGYPDGWPTDGRDGGAPDPAMAGPAFYQIGSEGGFLPQVALINPQPINYDYFRRSITITNVLQHSLYMGPAERADVIIDFSQFAGRTIILYNDAPAPNPGFDPRYDYYTGDPDQTASGGAYSTLPGYGPNTRTIMQFQVAAGVGTPFNRAPLETALPTTYVATQPPPIVPETFYPPPYQAATDTFGYIQSQNLTFTPVGRTTPQTSPLLSKAIVEMFDIYGRMNATLGSEVTDWAANPATSTAIGFPYIDPAYDILYENQPQIWKITHNGVDTHAIHFHLVNVQLINRVGWDNTIRPPEPNERGWKETIKMNPLEDIYIAMKPTKPKLPFPVPNSVRLLNPSMPVNDTSGFSNIDPQGNPITPPTTNVMTNFGWEYVWHCHLLGHEENDMMRPLVFRPAVIHGWIDWLLLLN